MFHVMAREPTSVREEEDEEQGVEEEARRDRRMAQQLECMQFLHGLPIASNSLLLVNDKV